MWKAALFWLILALPAVAQDRGFAGLGAEAEGFAVPERGQALEFPRDHGAHPDYRIEWWYLTATLRGADGREYGVQWTLFRSALAPGGGAGGWATPQIWMGHAGMTTPEAHFAAERFARGGVGQAGVEVAPFAAFIDDWEMLGEPGTADALDRLRLRAGQGDWGYDLRLVAEGPLVLHGDGGFSVKSEAGQASWYYSQPFYRVEGVLRLPGGEVEVTGQGWLDREWSSQPLAPDQEGWDWVALTFDDGARMMGFRLRGAEVFTYASWIEPDGTVTAEPFGTLEMEPLATADVAGRDVPVRWRVRLPQRGVDVEVAAVNPQSWMPLAFPYWEGPVRVSGSHAGRGYLEMTGYAPRGG